MRTLTSVPLFLAPGQRSLVHSPVLPDIPSPSTGCAPAAAMRRSASGLASDSPWGLSAVLRTSFCTRSLVSRIQPHRVRIVGPHWTYQSTDYPFTSSCSPPHLAVTQLLSVTGVSLRHRGTSTLLHRCAFQAHGRGQSCPRIASPSPGMGRLAEETILASGAWPVTPAKARISHCPAPNHHQEARPPPPLLPWPHPLAMAPSL